VPLSFSRSISIPALYSRCLNGKLERVSRARCASTFDAWRYIGEAIAATKTTKQLLFEAEINRVAGEIALKSPDQDAAKAEAYFERALAVARQQQAKSWELRAAMGLARLWRDQSKVQ